MRAAAAAAAVLCICFAPRAGGLVASVPLVSTCTCVAPTPLSRASAVRCCSAEDDRGAEENVEEAQLLKKTRKGTYKAYKPKDDRDTLLYDATEITPPPTKLGLFRLSPNAGCGDLISAPVRTSGRSSAHTYVIKRVSYRYAYQSGSYRMVGKGVDVKKTSRDATEAFLERLLPPDSGVEEEEELQQEKQQRGRRRRQESDD